MDTQFFSFKKLFFAYTLFSVPFALLAGILSLLNVIPVYFNATAYYGIKGLIITIIFIPFVGIIFSITNWLALNFGVLLYRKISKKKN